MTIAAVLSESSRYDGAGVPHRLRRRLSGDRIEPAVELVERGNLDAIVFECLAERTIALAQQAKAANPTAGFDPRLEDRMDAVLAEAHARGVRIITNMGAANPRAAGARVRAVAERLGIQGLTIAVVTGDDVRAPVTDGHLAAPERGRELTDANVIPRVLLGAEPIVERARTNVVITGRACRSVAVFTIAVRSRLAAADSTLADADAHICRAGQVTGGYFADPGVKDVPDLARLIYREVDADGSAVVTKVLIRAAR
jgi:hypothetical protein